MTSAPNLAISNRADAAAINSMAQQANPIGIGQSEFLRIQLIQASSREKMMLPSILESYAAGAVVTMRPQYDRGHWEQVKYFTRGFGEMAMGAIRRYGEWAMRRF